VLERASDLAAEDWQEVPVSWPWPEEAASGEWIAPVPATEAGQQFYRFKVKTP
jgi:hypothetical protein